MNNIKIGTNCRISSLAKVGGRPYFFRQDDDGYFNELDEKVYRSVIIGDNVFMNPYVNVEYGVYRDTVIGDNTKIDSFVIVGHDAVIGKSVLLNTGAKILGHVEIGDYSKIGPNAVIHQKVKIGKNCLVGANSYVRHDIPDGEVWYGTPARKIDNYHYPKKTFK